MTEELKSIAESDAKEEVVEKKEKKELTATQKGLIFAARLVAFILCSIGGPCAYIMARFKPFTAAESTQIGFAGAIMILIILVGAGVLIAFYLEGMKTRYSLLKQIMQGVLTIILPLVGLLVLFWGMQKYLEQLIEIVAMLIPFELAAIIVNPLPKWAFENNIDGLGNIMCGLLDKVQNKKDSK